MTLSDGAQNWVLRPGELGMSLDAAATAQAATLKGRSFDGLRALPAAGASWFAVAPVWAYDAATAERHSAHRPGRVVSVHACLLYTSRCV